MLTALLLVGGYLCGSLPTGEWFAHQAGVDVRRAGSGNVGATNVARTAGASAGVLTLFADVAKGLVPTLFAALLAPVTAGDHWRVAAVGLSAFLGHVYPIFSRFSGGKGVATAFGAFLILAPLAAAAGALMFLLVAFSTRYVSVASMLGALTLAVCAVPLKYPMDVRAAGFAAAAIILWRHRANLARLRSGQEPKFSFRDQAK